MTDLVCPDTPAASEYATVHIAWELSKADWKLGVILPGAKQTSCFAIEGGDLAAAAARLAAIRVKAGKAGLPVRILSCYEAGFEGHWLHRWLEGQGVVSHEIDPSSIEVNRRARRAKTDRIDLERLMRAFLAHLRGEPKACSIVNVPSPAEEDDKRSNRERERLLKERTAHTNRIKALLHAQGVGDVQPLARDFLTRLKDMRTGDGRPPPPRLAAEIAREHQRLVLADQQIAAIEALEQGRMPQGRAGVDSGEDRAAHPAQSRRRHRRQRPGETHRHRRRGAQADGGAVALSRNRRRSRRRRASSELLTGEPCRRRT